MLTTEAFNALLKVLEEPPSHVVFVFATTEAASSIPATIVSRCQKFDFRSFTLDEIADPAGASRPERGGSRDRTQSPAPDCPALRGWDAGALGFLDQCIAFASGEIREASSPSVWCG